MKKYEIKNEETLWGNDYGREDALKIIDELEIVNDDKILISFSDEIEDVVISYVEGFFNTFSKRFSKEFCKNNIIIDSKINDIVLPFAKYVTSTKFEETGNNE
ncbi:hypothetical protein R2F61_07960 [Mollicutes bacterium LVI A0078]|nr:hypothetical protein RZE84_07735 [Mollicutes bacterium LVI A0075]WOO90649.1 hypothetical protein R2F61_07960 [Mollicutes bacterium LVI A0078]